ncbi:MULTISPECIES: hypothetical protein [Kordiimonas]|jgi:hypothetical protein|uniref:hypothetical protein n=1 Tax=Kordiimonas TaxID=288021 RepID=UPI00257AD6E0|nr:hypothetical protein [Kordiimonas sp. UBA4487]
MVASVNLTGKSDTSLELVRENRLCKEIVFADGIGSSGKGMLSHILGSLTRIEKQSNHTPFDYIAYIHWLGKISDDAAITYLRTEADQQLYHIMMSRDVNFRPKDSTGVMQNANRWRYFARLFMREGDAVLDRIYRDRPILNEAPHDALRNAKLFFDAFGEELSFIYIIRDPYELILDWQRRGFGERIGTDPREFQFSVNIGETIVPMFMMNYEGFDYEKMTALERLTLMIHFCVQTNFEGYLNCSKHQQSKIKILTFDQLCTDTENMVEEVGTFLGVEKTKATRRILKQERLPRVRPKRDHFRSKVVDQLDDRLSTFIEDLDNLYQQFKALS